MIRAVIAACTLFLSGSPLAALEFSRSGATLTMSGPIRSGDEFRLFEMMRGVDLTSIRVVRLNSPGGRIAPATEIGRYIRKNRWTTLIPAGARCSSACTLLFSSGVRRHYVGGNFADGQVPRNGFTGLAYHEGNAPLSRDANRYSGAATNAMIGMYYEFGTPRAAEPVTKAPPDRFWRISGTTALALGIATSLSPP